MNKQTLLVNPTMNQQPILVNSEHKCYEMFSEPVHFPFVIGNEQFIITMQDQRNIFDRRNWYLSRPPNIMSCNTAVSPGRDQEPINPYFLQEQMVHGLNVESAHLQMPTASGQQIQCGQKKPFGFHYEKQTDTDDLPYFQNVDRRMHGEKVVKHVHYFVESAVKNKATNTETDNSNAQMEVEEITDIEDILDRCIGRQ